MKRTIHREYRISIGKEMLRGGKAVAQICRENDLGRDVLRCRKREYEQQEETPGGTRRRRALRSGRTQPPQPAPARGPRTTNG